MDCQTARLEMIFQECAKLSHMPVDSITWKKRKFYRAQDSRKTIGSLFSAQMKEDSKKDQFCKIELVVEYKAIGG